MTDLCGAVILAAGAGTRLGSDRPKALVPILGQAAVAWLWQTLSLIGIKDIVTVIHPSDQDLFLKVGQDENYIGTWAFQPQRLGTADAAQHGLSVLKTQRALVLCADAPAISKNTLQKILRHPCALLAFEGAGAYGRIQHQAGWALKILEGEDMHSSALANAGVYVLDRLWALKACAKTLPQGPKSEHWLTDIIAHGAQDGHPFWVEIDDDPQTCRGINTPQEWHQLKEHLNQAKSWQAIAEGVQLASHTDIQWSAQTHVAKGSSIARGCHFEGRVLIEEGVRIEAHCTIKNSVIKRGAHIKASSYLEHAIIGEHASIGPFAHVIDSTCDAEVQIGNYVEVRRSRIDQKSKIKHLSYLGDTQVEKGVNIGAGVIICNYDGQNKHPTLIRAGAFIGSNSTLIAPIEIGECAVIGAGTVLTQHAPAGMLTLSRTACASRATRLSMHLQKRLESLDVSKTD